MRTVLVDITGDDIRNGKRQDSLYCPAALAFTRVLGRRIAVGVTTAGPHPLLPPAVVYYLPTEMSRWIMRYDNKETVDPTVFEVEIPDDD